MRPVEADAGNFYSWGTHCSGWRLLDIGHFQVRQEAMPPGAAEEPHVHQKAHQFFYVLDGEMTLRTPENGHCIRPRQGIHVPPGRPHWVLNEGASDLIFILASSPSTSGDRITVDTKDWDLTGIDDLCVRTVPSNRSSISE